MTHLSFETAWAVFKRLPEYTAIDLDAMGIAPEDLQLMKGKRPWRIDHVETVMRVLTGFIYGSAKILRLPPITIPSEYIAPIIAALVGPANQTLCCIWLSQQRHTGVGILELAARAQSASQMGETNADQLNALVTLLMSQDGAKHYRDRFEAAIGYEIEKAMEEEVNPQKKGRGNG